MHDPDSLIADIRIPIPFCFTPNFCNGKRYRRYINIAQIWHHDPCKGGSDDSCGRFMRASHGDDNVIQAAVKRLEWDWSRTFQLSRRDYEDDCEEYGMQPNLVRYVGMFKPNGTPVMSTIGIVINIYFAVLVEHFKINKNVDRARKKTHKYINDNLSSILLFAENPTDSLHSSITNVFGSEVADSTDERQRERKQRQQIQSLVCAVYGDILRTTRPWYKHPNFHVHHWQIKLAPVQYLKRLFQRCSKCNRHMWREQRSYNWHGDRATCTTCEPLPQIQATGSAVAS